VAIGLNLPDGYGGDLIKGDAMPNPRDGACPQLNARRIRPGRVEFGGRRDTCKSTGRSAGKAKCAARQAAMLPWKKGSWSCSMQGAEQRGSRQAMANSPLARGGAQALAVVFSIGKGSLSNSSPWRSHRHSVANTAQGGDAFRLEGF